MDIFVFLTLCVEQDVGPVHGHVVVSVVGVVDDSHDVHLFYELAVVGHIPQSLLDVRLGILPLVRLQIQDVLVGIRDPVGVAEGLGVDPEDGDLALVLLLGPDLLHLGEVVTVAELDQLRLRVVVGDVQGAFAPDQSPGLSSIWERAKKRFDDRKRLWIIWYQSVPRFQKKIIRQENISEESF